MEKYHQVLVQSANLFINAPSKNRDSRLIHSDFITSVYVTIKDMEIIKDY